MRKAFGVVLVLTGLAALGLSGFGYWTCFFAADADLPQARELKQQAAEDMQRRASRRGKDPDKAERSIREAQEFLKEWDDILRQTDQTIQDKSSTWRVWLFVSGTLVLLFGLGAIITGVDQFRFHPSVSAEPGAAPDRGGS